MRVRKVDPRSTYSGTSTQVQREEAGSFDTYDEAIAAIDKLRFPDNGRGVGMKFFELYDSEHYFYMRFRYYKRGAPPQTVAEHYAPRLVKP